MPGGGYPATRFWATPIARPPANAIGMDRSPPSTAAVVETNRISVYWVGLKPNSGAPTTPARPASIMLIAHATLDVRPGLMPRIDARSRRSTVARSSRPNRVRRTTYHSTAAESTAAPKITSWLESITTVP